MVSSEHPLLVVNIVLSSLTLEIFVCLGTLVGSVDELLLSLFR
jgi:hypothetical protein